MVQYADKSNFLVAIGKKLGFGRKFYQFESDSCRFKRQKSHIVLGQNLKVPTIAHHQSRSTSTTTTFLEKNREIPIISVISDEDCSRAGNIKVKGGSKVKGLLIDSQFT